MSPRWRALWRQFLPSPGTLTLLGAALGVLVLGAGCALSFMATADVDDPGGVAVFILGIVVTPIVVILLAISTIREKRPAPRALIWLFAALLVGAAGLVTAVVIAQDQEMGAGGGSAIFVIFCAPIALGLFLPSIYFGRKAAPDIRAAQSEEHALRLEEMLEARGDLTFADVSQELDIDLDRVDDLLDTLIASDRLEAVVPAGTERVFSKKVLTARRRRLMGTVRARGRIQLDDLAEELHVPMDMLKEWIYDLVGRGRFTGYIDWYGGTLYSQEAQELSDGSTCPQCSGPLRPAGKGIIRCEYCGTEVFLKGSAEG